MSKRVLITGHNGYLGSVMVPAFLGAGYDVVGLDTGYFRECTLINDPTETSSINKDIRDLTPEDLSGFHAVVHLAALSNDPIGNLRREWTQQINVDGSVRLAQLAKQAGVQRFLFSSSCIMYGMSEAEVATEDSPLDPKTDYARSKVESEYAISALAGNGFSPTFLRNGTVYGLSPRMRFDTVFNNLIGTAVATGRVVVNSDGQPWRPVVHVQDVARSFLRVLAAPLEQVHNQAFNNGAETLNTRVIDLAKIAVETVPDCTLEVRAEAGADQRTYKADFSKFQSTFPDFQFEWTPHKGARELYDAFQDIRLTNDQLTSRLFTRLKWLTFLLESGQLNNSLRWSSN